MKTDKNSLLIHLDIFHRDLLVVWGSEDKVRDALSEYHEDDEIQEMLADFHTWDKGHTIYAPTFNAYVLWIPKKNETAQDVGFLAHEVFHATRAIMDNIGIPLSDDSEEAYAYTLGYITEEILSCKAISSYPSQ